MTMKILSVLSGLALVTFGVTASAHAHLQRASPADGSVITTSPSNLVLNFSEAARHCEWSAASSSAGNSQGRTGLSDGSRLLHRGPGPERQLTHPVPDHGARKIRPIHPEELRRAPRLYPVR